jgi:predicted phage terminase large subunit-like protein
VRISLPQDPGQAGKAQVLYLTKHLIGYVVESTPETGDKATRAMPLVSQANVGNVSLVRAPWNRAYLEELRDFPGGTKDDQVDASSRAFNTLTAAPAPARRMQINIIGR